RRLAILDLSEAAAQPMLSADGRLALVFNGELYNHRELRQELASRGRTFRTTSDTEVLLGLWDQHGPEMLSRLRGMYAFALWDARDQSLFLARDPFGIKPLYLADDGRTLRFASQVKALLAGGALPSAPDLAGWAGFHLLGYVPEPHTLYTSIRALPAGTALLLRRDGAPRTIRHFDLSAELQAAEAAPLDLSAGEAQTRLREALAGSVRAHLVSDVPVGLFLSAGLDSSTLAALAAEATETSPGRLQALTLGFREFEGTPQDESPLAAVAARHAGVDHTVRWIAKADFEAHLDRALAAMDQPSIDGLNTYFVSLAAREAGMKVALSGLGGDELLGGYPSFRQVPRMARTLAPIAPIARRGLGALSRRLLAPWLPARISPKWAGLLEYGGTIPGAYLLRRALRMPWELPHLLGTRDSARALEELDLPGRLAASVAGLRSRRLQVMALELGWYMGSQLLKDSDWAGMAHGLEIRVPLVDPVLFRALAPIQAGPRPLGKRDLAACPAKGLPQAIVDRPKTGFGTPIGAWTQDRVPAGSTRGLRGWAQVVGDPGAHPVPRQQGKRILYLATDGFGGHGGIAQYNRDVLAALCAHPGIREVVALPRLMPHLPGPLPAGLSWDPRGLGGKGAYAAAVARRALGGRRFDLVICGHLNLLPLAAAAARAQGAPLGALIFGIDAWTPLPGRIARRLARRPVPVASISDLTLRKFQAWADAAGRPTAILPNAIHLEAYGAGPKPADLLQRYGLQGRPVLLTLGRMVQQERYKGFDEVLDLLPRLRAERPGLTYVLAGDGEDQPRLAAKAERLGLQDAVRFTGRIPEHEKADHFRLADAYVMPSRGEGFGFVVLEALACGIPVVASTVDGTREAVRDGALGRLVDPGDAEALRSAILAALDEGPGPVPEGLHHFAFPAFTDRVHRVVESWWSAL
ncbi:MAG TPA: asparagine synthase (glutamine-hydrolyzing), partial [Holophagaceae bacterium]|nr:asparagine synthase (glutamine-hydrolyzing) [Holophagaceae bacterium]